MKRETNLYSKISDWDNLLLAFYKAARHKRNAVSTRQYEKNLYKNVRQLQKNIINETIPLGGYRFFKIFDPKERIICAVPFCDRVLHHAIMNICEETFEKFQMYDSYACRKGKGTKKAVYRAWYFAKKYKYCIKLDMQKYFDSISHQKLQELLKRKFKDKKLLTLFDHILFSYSVRYGKGLPIGNLTSQYFANYYLAFFDRYAKEELKIKGYIRYMDDILIFAHAKSECRCLLQQAKTFLDTLCLTVKIATVCTSKTGIPFLGFLVRDRSLTLLQEKKRRINKKIMHYTYKLKNNVWSEEDYALHAIPLLARTAWTNGRHTP